ncbi:MAG: NAD-dependent epimerase/dehydratase family protein [Lysobacterales bacterium]|jgi:nucleoside-diphosphate-sugar epimerase
MTTKVFLAGATGVIGRCLGPLLTYAGYAVFGMTRHRSKAVSLKRAGVTPVVLDVFNVPALLDALKEIRPEVVIHQLTDLPANLDPALMDEAIRRNARIRNAGTQNLVNAALASGSGRLVAQSIAWAYAPGREPCRESDPLDLDAEGNRAVTVGGVAKLEELTLYSPPLEGVVLRYGHLYGPHTGADEPASNVNVHVDAAAHAAVLAVEECVSGVFNIAEPNGAVSINRARQELGWDAAFRWRGESGPTRAFAAGVQSPSV